MKMRITFLENGIDSLQKGFRAFLEFEKNTVSCLPTTENYLTLKEAILSTHHGVEILMKYILSQESEFLIVDKIDEKYIRAYSEKKKSGKKSIFETSMADGIHTITYSVALDRIQALSKIKVSNGFLERLKAIEKYRNALTHSEIDLPDQELVDIFPQLLNELDIFFFKAIGSDYKTLSGYDDLQKNYDAYMEILNQKGSILKKSAVEAIKKSLEKADLIAGFDEIKRITDIAQAKRFISSLNSHKLSLGLDMYNGYCSGQCTVKIIDDSHFSFDYAENESEYIFKFKSLIVYMPKALDTSSPILIFESDKDKEPLQNLPEEARSIYADDDYIELFVFEDGSYEFDYSVIAEQNYREDYEHGYVAPEYTTKFFFMIPKVIGALNVQGLPYWDFHKLLHLSEGKDGHEIEVRIRSDLEKKKK